MTADRILIVDDEAPIRRFLKIALGSGGFAVIEAERGRQGVELAATARAGRRRARPWSARHGRQGRDRRDREWSQVPILILSVRDGEAEKITALDAGADDYVTKPFATGELMARLRAALRKRPAGSIERRRRSA